MQLVKSTEEHIPLLVALSKAAFDSDTAVGAPEPDGPLEYDSPEWHAEMMKQGHLYTALEGDTVVGGAILFGDERAPSFMYVGRIFIDPARFGQGLGVRLMEQIEDMHPHVTDWRLDTPIWNVRTNRFYRKLGYEETSRDDEMVYYQKITRRA